MKYSGYFLIKTVETKTVAQKFLNGFVATNWKYFSHKRTQMEKQFETKIIKILPTQEKSTIDSALKPAVDFLQNDEVVAFPTETVYGLGANALSATAVDKIFKAKGRPSDNPLIVHISNFEQLKHLVDEKAFPTPGTIAHTLCKRFWPGALTILFKKSNAVPSNVTANLDRVAVRMPSHPIANRFIELSNLPIAAPSANVSGRPSPTSANHVIEDLGGKIPCVIDGGSSCDYGVESTVVDINSNPPLILRPGGVTFEMLKEFIPDLQIYEKKVHGTQLEAKPPTPGLKYKHYSPSAKVVLFEQGAKDEIMKEKVMQRLLEEISKKNRVGVIHTHLTFKYDLEKLAEHQNSIVWYDLGDHTKPISVAKGLFRALRDLDSQKVDVILMEGIAEDQEGLAVMNRIRKASGEIIAT